MLIANLRHPNILVVFDSGEQDGMAYIVTELVEGGTLEDHLGRAMRAVRDNELAAGVNGIDVFRTKVYAFAICAALGGLAGGLFAGHPTSVTTPVGTPCKQPNRQADSANASRR